MFTPRSFATCNLNFLAKNGSKQNIVFGSLSTTSCKNMMLYFCAQKNLVVGGKKKKKKKGEGGISIVTILHSKDVLSTF